MHDLNHHGALAQHGQRVQQALHRVVACHELLRVGIRREAVALVVDDQRDAVFLLAQEVDDAGHERRAVAEAEGKGMLAPKSRGRGDAPAERPVEGAGEQTRKLLALRGARLEAELARDHPDTRRVRWRAAGELQALHQPVHQHPPGPRLESARRCGARRADALLGHPQYPFEVVAVAATLELAERCVAERRRQRRRARDPHRLHTAMAAARRRRRRNAVAGVGARRRRRRSAGRLALRRLLQDRAVRGGSAERAAQPRRRARPDGQFVDAAAALSDLNERRAQRRAQPLNRWRDLAGRRPGLEVDGAAQQQSIAGARHRHVKHAILLLGLAPAPLGAQLLEFERRVDLAVAHSLQAQPDSISVDEQPRRPDQRLAPEVGDTHDRELQALGRVHGHQLHRVGLDAFDGRLGLCRLSPSQVLDVVDEGAQVATFACFEAARQTQQLVDVGEPALAPVESQHVYAVVAVADHPLDQLGDRALGSVAALPLEATRRTTQRCADRAR